MLLRNYSLQILNTQMR